MLFGDGTAGVPKSSEEQNAIGVKNPRRALCFNALIFRAKGYKATYVQRVAKLAQISDGSCVLKRRLSRPPPPTPPPPPPPPPILTHKHARTCTQTTLIHARANIIKKPQTNRQAEGLTRHGGNKQTKKVSLKTNMMLTLCALGTLQEVM